MHCLTLSVMNSEQANKNKERKKTMKEKIVLFIHDGVVSGGFTSDPSIEVVTSVFETDLDSQEGEDKFWEQCKEEGLQQFDPDIIHYKEGERP